MSVAGRGIDAVKTDQNGSLVLSKWAPVTKGRGSGRRWILIAASKPRGVWGRRDILARLGDFGTISNFNWDLIGVHVRWCLVDWRWRRCCGRCVREMPMGVASRCIARVMSSLAT